MAGGDELDDGVGADVAGSAADEDAHGHTVGAARAARAPAGTVVEMPDDARRGVVQSALRPVEAAEEGDEMALTSRTCGRSGSR